MAVGIYALISEERLRDVLSALHEFTALPITLTDETGAPLLTFGGVTTYCGLIRRHVFLDDECRKTRLGAARHAQTLGEPYIFACGASVNHIAFPLQSHGALMGCVFVGPFLMDHPDSTLVSGMDDIGALGSPLLLELYDALHELQVILPPRVSQLSRLTWHLLSPLMPSEIARMHMNQEMLYQQSRLNESIQMYKEQGLSETRGYLFRKESELMTKVRTGSVRDAKALLNDLLGYVLFTEGGKLDAVRIRAIELTTLLSRVAMDGGARVESIDRLNGQFLSLMHQSQTLDSLCYLLQDVVESFMSAMFSGEGSGNAHIRAALRIIAERYAQPLSVTEVARAVGLSPNYFSALFKGVTGVSFQERLCLIRVEESKRLLLSTDYPLADIALSMGFADQSYFCRVFKRVTGVTPSQFRHGA